MHSCEEPKLEETYFLHSHLLFLLDASCKIHTVAHGSAVELSHVVHKGKVANTAHETLGMC